ncbi:hypothetical protein CQ046_12940 [Chryseobacterium sp. MYb7]|nr:hypothetical protein CQ046_12940 [Chryseobacterium sp. MYb7]
MIPKRIKRNFFIADKFCDGFDPINIAKYLIFNNFKSGLISILPAIIKAASEETAFIMLTQIADMNLFFTYFSPVVSSE